MKRISILALAITLAACSQQNAPSEALEKEADSLVEAAQGSEPSPAALAGPFAPRNECSELEGAEPFLAMLRGAVTARDAQAVANLAAEDVKLDFGGGAGRGELLSRLQTPDSPLWTALDQLMQLGCASNDQGGITLPWYFAQNDFPVDPMMGMIVTGENVPLRAEPEVAAREIMTLSWDAVEVVMEPESVEGWRHLRVPATDTREETIGWMQDASLRSYIDYRIIASSRNKTWRITSLIAGD